MLMTVTLEVAEWKEMAMGWSLGIFEDCWRVSEVGRFGY